FTDINFLETISLVLEIILRVDAPRTPLAAVQRQFHRQRGNKRTMIAASTYMLFITRISQSAPPKISIRFRPNNASRTRFAGEDTFSRLGRIIQRNNA